MWFFLTASCFTRSPSFDSVANHSGNWTCVTRCWVISWFVYSQCATRGYSLLSTRHSVCPWAATLLLRNLGALALAAAKPQFSLFVFLLAHAHQPSGHLSVVSGPAGWGLAVQVSLAHACPGHTQPHVTTHQSCGTKNIASNNIGSQSAQHRPRRADGRAQEAKSRCRASSQTRPLVLCVVCIGGAAVTGHVSRARVET